MSDVIDSLLGRAIERAAELRRLPVSTYRLQFHAGFTFRDATAILPYLAKLGVTHVYASPYLAARAGSTHGYDVIDHCRLNPELGTEVDYAGFLDGLKANGLSHILDTVPNHVGVNTNDNTWWNDVLEHGPASRFASYFDITWRSSSRPELHDKVLIPTLGKPYGEALEAGELKLSFDADAGRFWLNYYDRRFPISPGTYDVILCHRSEECGDAAAELCSVGRAAAHLPHPWQADPASVGERTSESDSIKGRLAALVRDKSAQRHIESVLADFNGTPGDPASFDALDRLLDRQCFRLADWHVAFDEINYRRFFDVNDLAALRMESPEVFEATHSFILPKLAQGEIAGLRIDHPDGLFDPAGYLLRLQRHYLLAIAETLYDGDDWSTVRKGLLERLEAFNGTGEGPPRWPLFVSVEKILAMHEPLIADWATHGTSGYDFLVQLNALFVDPAAEQSVEALWREMTSDERRYDDYAHANKKHMLDSTLASELHSLTHLFDRLAQRDRHGVDFTFRALQAALRETIACFGVYRTYVMGPEVSDTDKAHINAAIDKAKEKAPRLLPAAFEYIRRVLTQQYTDRQDAEDRRRWQEATGKFQQLTSPVTAKGIEDTTFYQFNRFLSLNEVGGEPAIFGIPPQQFQAFLSERQANWPFALSGSSTHDTKRSEDVRARLNVLSDIPEKWSTAVRHWFEVSAPLRTTTSGGPSPAPYEELLIYQTLIGAWPLDRAAEPDFAERIHDYLLKAMREAKTRTRWGDADEAHEAAVRSFTDALLDPAKSSAFHATFAPLLREVAHFGLMNSLSQTLIKLISPGVPDIYQGNELWDFSLVDPDNRRPVDYAKRQSFLDGLENLTPDILLRNLSDGRAKLKVTTEGLRLRRNRTELFARGDVQPLTARGEMAAHVFGIIRTHGEQAVAAIVPLRVPGIVGKDTSALPIGTVWGNTTIDLPGGGPWRNVLTGEVVTSNTAASVLATFPVALLVR